MGRLTAVLAGLALLLAVRANAEDYTGPGPFAVGLRKLSILDATGKHPRSTMVWYPAAGPAPDRAAQLGDKADAPPATTGPYPLVLIIHGLTGQGAMFGPVGRRFASYGFVVAAADYDTGPSGNEGSSQDRQAAWMLHERPNIAMQVIGFVDTLGAPGGPLAGVVDTSRIGVWGLSTGGTTAIQAAGAQVDLNAMDDWCATRKDDGNASETCQFVGHEQAVARSYGVSDPFAAPMPPLWDPRVAALVAAAPGGELHAFGGKGMAAVKVPTLIMFASDDSLVSPELNALWAYGAISSPDKALATFESGGHTFSMSIGSPDFDEATALATGFFAAILKGDPAARAGLMPDAVSFPGLSYKTTLK